jgi:hypothetical protein
LLVELLTFSDLHAAFPENRKIVENLLPESAAEGTVHARLRGARRKLVAGLERYYPFGADSGEGAIQRILAVPGEGGPA